MCKSVQAAKKGFVKSIFRGNTRIKEGNWLPSREYAFKKMVGESQSQPIFVKDLFYETRKEWNATKIWNIFTAETTRVILSLDLPSTDIEDQIHWKDEGNRKATASAVYKHLIRDRNEFNEDGGTNMFWKKLWKCKMHPKWRFFVWKIMNKALATKQNLNRRGIHVDSKCVFNLDR